MKTRKNEGTKVCSHCGLAIGHDHGCVYEGVDIRGQIVKVEILPRGNEKITGIMEDLHSKPSPAMGILFAGDRWACVEKVAVAEVDGKIVGIATIAPKGEQVSGKPTIVGLYVQHQYRQKGSAIIFLRQP
ncbi:hypothetical protein C4572_03955 [Candidatus Parcubacteria bacterium]|nr:MAG: hypothetical protein C4572_03955 [Candidatus Parcubacteria bacterium]